MLSSSVAFLKAASFASRVGKAAIHLSWLSPPVRVLSRFSSASISALVLNPRSTRQRIKCHLKSAKAGSDHQLQFARSFAALAHSKEQGAEIRNILDGKFQELQIDADLRWHLILCLVERGLGTRAEIDAELKRDNTLTGALSHERCIASISALVPNPRSTRQRIKCHLKSASHLPGSHAGPGRLFSG